MGYGARYDEDFYAWTQDQAGRLREASASGANLPVDCLPVDWENLAEEIESMGRRDAHWVASHLGRVIEHLLKLEHSPSLEPRSGWRRSVRNARGRLEIAMGDSPSLRAKADEYLAWAWKMGRGNAVDGLAADGMGGAELPADCPYTMPQILDEEWWPENRHGLTP